MNVGLLFCSFNPIHKGHVTIAKYFEQLDVLDEVWIVVTPVNPFKEKDTTVSNIQRLEMCKLAVSGTNIKVSDVEFEMEAPNYTFVTLQLLRSMHADNKFSIIMGDDNLTSLHLWKNYEDIIYNHDIMVYPRGEGIGENELIHNYKRYNAPLLPWSSTSVRELLLAGKDVSEMIDHSVQTYISTNWLYK